MNHINRFITFLLISCMLLLMMSAVVVCEPAMISTGGGSLNVRKEASTQSKLVTRLKNGTSVEVNEIGDEWCHIIAGKTSGYVQKKYLKLASSAKGKDVYTNGDTVYLRESPDDDSRIIAVATCREPLHVYNTENGWSLVSVGDTRGYIQYEKIAEQNEQAVQVAKAVLTQGLLLKKQEVYSQPDKRSKVIATLPKQWSAQAIRYDNKWCMVYVDGEYGYVPVSSVQMTGADIVDENAVWKIQNDYTANYYTGHSASQSLTLYAAPTEDLQDIWQTVTLSEGESFKVLQKDYVFEGNHWSRIWLADGIIGWVPATNVSFSDEMSEYHYENPITKGANAVAYVGDQDAKVYAEASARTKKLATIPAGSEISVSVGEVFSGVTWQGIHGWISNNDITFGFALSGNWQEETSDEGTSSVSATTGTLRKPGDDTSFISLDTAKGKAVTALKKAYPKFQNDSLSCAHETYETGYKGIKGPLDFFVFSDKNGKYMYGVMVDSVTGETLYTEDYSSFGNKADNDIPATRKPKATATPLPDYPISASQAKGIAEAALSSKYGDFAGAPISSVLCNAYASKPGYEGPFWQLEYLIDGNVSFMCMVHCNTGNVIYINDTWDPSLTEIDYSEPTPTEAPPQGEIMSQKAAKDIGYRYLSSKYPQFSSAHFARIEENLLTESADGPVYVFSYYDEVNMNFPYSVTVNAITGEIEYSSAGFPGEGNG